MSMDDKELCNETYQKALDLYKDWLIDEVKHEIYELEETKDLWRVHLHNQEDELQLKEIHIEGEIYSLGRILDFLEGKVDRLYETR